MPPKLVEAVGNEGSILCKDMEECTNGCLGKFIMNQIMFLGYNVALCKST